MGGGEGDNALDVLTFTVCVRGGGYTRLRDAEVAPWGKAIRLYLIYYGETLISFMVFLMLK
jgi:hypothetical protein